VNLREALARAEARLAAAGCATPGLDARVLLGQVTGLGHAGLLAHGRDALGARAARFETLVRRRERREPVAYLTGRKEFFSRSFEVTPAVLVPRPETERVVEAGLVFLRLGRDRATVVDVGTGSGAIAITLAAQCDGARITALDSSPGALAVARNNARRLLAGEPGARLDLLLADLTTSIAPGSVDLVVANPPYLSRQEMRQASPELGFEPPHALAGGGRDGLEVVRRLLGDARRVLRAGGRLLCEIGAAQGDSAREIASGLGFAAVEVLLDLEGRARVLKADAAIAEAGGGTPTGA